MELKTQYNVQVTKGDNTYYFAIPDNATFGEAYDAAFEAMQYVRKMLHDASEQAEQEKQKEDDDDSSEASAQEEGSCDESDGA